MLRFHALSAVLAVVMVSSALIGLAADRESTASLVDRRRALIDCFRDSNQLSSNRDKLRIVSELAINGPLDDAAAQLLVETFVSPSQRFWPAEDIYEKRFSVPSHLMENAWADAIVASGKRFVPVLTAHAGRLVKSGATQDRETVKRILLAIARFGPDAKEARQPIAQMLDDPNTYLHTKPLLRVALANVGGEDKALVAAIAKDLRDSTYETTVRSFIASCRGAQWLNDHVVRQFASRIYGPPTLSENGLRMSGMYIVDQALCVGSIGRKASKYVDEIRSIQADCARHDFWPGAILLAAAIAHVEPMRMDDAFQVVHQLKTGVARRIASWNDEPPDHEEFNHERYLAWSFFTSRAYGVMDPTLARYLGSKLNGDNEDDTATAVLLLCASRLDARDAIDGARKCLHTNPDPQRRAWAVAVIAMIGNYTEVAELKRALKREEHPSVRTAIHSVVHAIEELERPKVDISAPVVK